MKILIISLLAVNQLIPFIMSFSTLPLRHSLINPTKNHNNFEGQIWTSPFDTTENAFDTYEVEKQSISKHHKGKLRVKNSELYLPKNVQPISYKLRIRPILDSSNATEFLTAPGSVEIVIRCIKETNSIVLHANTRKYIRIHENTLRVENNNIQNGTGIKDENDYRKPIMITGHSIPSIEEADFYEIQLSESLIPGEEYAIFMEFVSRISDTTLDGLYLSKYVDPISGDLRYLATTQFEDIAARQMFPCFDEPDLKATFEITISRSNAYNSMSNMPSDFTVPDPDKENYFLDHYPPTPKMSTYLVALIVSNFKCETAPTTLYNKVVQACGPPHLIDNSGGKHAATISAKLLAYYDRFWFQLYPFPKMQSVAIPDFEAGAMENYGLNTYRINALIYFPGTTPEWNRYSIESTVAHELAHQNFGNLVTCKTWNNLFLNEGFATYVSYLGVQEISPEFLSEEIWYTGYFQRALKVDAMPDSHPIVKTEAYFGDFDGITYSKGASIIKMIENLISKDTLIHGLRNYLKLYSFQNTEYGNLLETLDEQANFNNTHPGVAPLTESMKLWIINPGFPLLTITMTSDHKLNIKQSRFIKYPIGSNGNKEGNQDANETPLWHIPIYITTSEDRKDANNGKNYVPPNLWLTKEDENKAWNMKEKTVDWIIVNPDSKVFVRVLYDDHLSNGIVQQLRKDFSVYSSITRAQLIDDAFECAWSRYSSIKTALDRTVYLEKEENPVVWSTVLAHFGYINAMLSSNPDAHSSLKDYIRPKLNQAINSIGVEQLPNAKGKIVMHRELLFAWATPLSLVNVLDYAQRLMEEWKNAENDNPVPVDIRGVVYCAAMAGGDENTVTFLKSQYKKANDNSHKRQIITALACSTQKDQLEGFLDAAICPDTGFEKSDSMALLGKLISNPLIRMESFNYLKKNHQMIADYFLNRDSVTMLLDVFSRYFNTQHHLNLVKEFVQEDLLELQYSSSVNKTIAKIEENITWMEIYEKDITDWLSNQSGASSNK